MSNQGRIEVLLIEDDPMVQEVNRQFIERVEGFKVIETASNGDEGLQLMKKLSPDLIILDIYMPEKDGQKTLKEIRGQGIDTDIIVITAANDKNTIRTMLQNGTIDYIIKPFKFERLEQALVRYKNYLNHVSGEGELQQQQIDQLIGDQPGKKDSQLLQKELPKGLNKQTLKQIVSFLEKQQESLSAEQVADGIGIARVTARRYLEYLQKTGVVAIDIQYGGLGRPVNRYQMKH